ncbi:MAG: pitrilysin family protein [Deltaproteobacteria bacterium]|nr:pitrilysin family protein [Deltaproteobacteria bacterium]
MTRHTLPNGLEVLIQEDHARKVATAQMWVMVGSADEEPSERGISHLIEHMAFKGTDRRGVGRIAGEVEALGGDINAYTSWDETVFHITAPSSAIAQTLDILTDAVLKPSIVPGELEKEKQVVLEEILESAERPERKASQLLFDNAYVASPYKYPIIGYKDIVEKITRDNIFAFRNKWYVPENMFLLIVGDVDTSAVLREVEKLTADLKPVGFFRPPRTTEPFQKDVRTSLVPDKNSRETRMHLAFHIPGVKSVDVSALDLAGDILGGRESSRLVKSLKKEKGLVHSISAYALTPKDPGVMVVSATLDFANIEAVTKGIMEEITQLIKEPPTNDELERAKVHIESQHVYSLETVQGMARSIGSFRADVGDPNYEEKYLILNRAVTPEEISEIMKIYLFPSNATISILAPDADPKDFKIDTLVQTLKSFQSGPKSAVEPKAVEPKTISTKLSNGMRVILTPDDSNPVVSFRIVHLGGKRYETRETQGIMNFVSQMITKGAGDLSEFEISRKIEDMGGRLIGFSGYDSFGLSASCFSRHLENGLKLLALIYKNPTFSQEKMERERQLIINRIKTEPDRPVQFALNSLNKVVFKSHPYGFDKEGTLTTVAGFTVEDLNKCYRKYSVPSNTVITVVGAIDPEKTVGILENLFGAVPASSFEPPKVPAELPVDRVRDETIRIPRAKAHIAIGFKAVDMADPNRYPLEVLNNLLSGQGGRLFLQLRDKESLAYVITSFVRPNLDPGLFGFYVACDVSKVDKAVNGLMSEIDKIRTNLISDKDVENAISNLIGNHAIALQSTWARAENNALNTLYGLGWDYEAEYVKKISEVKSQDVLRVAKEYLDPEKRVVVKIVPDEEEK